MKRGKRLLLLLLALTVVCAGVWAVTGQDPEDSTEKTDNTQEIFALDSSGVTSLSWTHDGETLEFTCAGDWAYAADSSFQFDRSILENMISALTSVTADKVIEEPEDLSQFGLDTPVCTVSVNGTAVLYLGDQTAMMGRGYVSVGDGKVYLVSGSLFSAFDYALEDLAIEADTTDQTEST